MELPQLGKQCSDASCKQLDFLPFRCKCGKLFCKEHYNIHTTLCSSNPADNQVQHLNKIDSFQCSEIDCKETSVIALICDKCKKHFCVKHRHIVDCIKKSPDEMQALSAKYMEPVRQFNENKKLVDKQVELNLRKSKNRNMAAQIQLMRIKNKATGLKSIPVQDRVYFNIVAPDKTVRPMFISKTWTLGRSIDVIAAECKLANNNNKANANKLKLYYNSHDIVSSSTTDSIEALINEGCLFDGQSLYIHFMDECF